MDKDGFLDSILEDYDDKIEAIFEKVTSSSDLESSHIEIMGEILEALPITWRDAMGSEEIPADFQKKLEQKLEANFAKLNRLFSKRRQREQSKLTALTVRKEALQFYIDDMEKYLQNHPNASPKEIEMQHGRAYRLTLENAQTKISLEHLTEMRGDLKKEMEVRRKVYIDRATMILMSNKDPAIGIDLGTTMCCVMVFYKGKVELVPNRSQGNSSTTPSYIAFHENGTDTFGQVAKEQSHRYPEITIYDAKRMIGRPFKDEKLQNDITKWPFEVVDVHGSVKIKTGDRCRFPHEVSAKLLARLKMMAESHLKLPRGTIKKAVITVPAYFTEPQRRATNDAALCAGLQVLKILSEPTAAAIAYTWERRDPGTRKALIYDLGGGTFDVAVAKVNDTNVEILCVDGDTHLGGQDFDQLLMEYCIQNFKLKTGIDLTVGRDSHETTARNEARSALSRIKLRCEKAKEELTTSEKTTIEIMGIHKNLNMSVVITKLSLENLIRPLIQTTLDIVARALVEAISKGVATKDDIDDIILVGGSTRIPLVKEMLTEYFGGKQLCVHINPDEAVAYGAAIQASLLNQCETIKHVQVQDVTPMSLGVSIINNKLVTLIPKNSKIPCKFDGKFATTIDNQTVIHWGVYQGENAVASKNKFLASFEVDGVPPNPKGKEAAIVTMAIDDNGILQVDAVSLSTGSSNSITISADRLGIDKKTMDQLIKECSEIQLY